MNRLCSSGSGYIFDCICNNGIKGSCPWKGTPRPRSKWEGRLAAVLTLRDRHLVEFDVVHHRPDLPVLQHRVSRHLTEVHHPWGQRRRGLSVCDWFSGPKPTGLAGVIVRRRESILWWREFLESQWQQLSFIEPFLCGRHFAKHSEHSAYIKSRG